jgi:hypothetical protein
MRIDTRISSLWNVYDASGKFIASHTSRANARGEKRVSSGRYITRSRFYPEEHDIKS